MKTLNSENLRQELWKTLGNLRAKKVDHKMANAIATQSREIVRIVRLELEAQRMNGSKGAGVNKFIGGSKTKAQLN